MTTDPITAPLPPLREVTQFILANDPSGLPGDCVRASVASLLDMDPAKVPHFTSQDDVRVWPLALTAFAAEHGWDIQRRLFDPAIDRLPEFGIAIGSTTRPAASHAVVIRGGEMVWDPHPSRDGLVEVKQVIEFTPHPRTAHNSDGLRREREADEICRSVTVTNIDGELITTPVLGEEPMSEEGQQAWGEVVRATQRRFREEQRAARRARDAEVRAVDDTIKAITQVWSGQGELQLLITARAELTRLFGEQIAALDVRDLQAAAPNPERYFEDGTCRLCGVQFGENHMFECGNVLSEPRTDEGADTEKLCSKIVLHTLYGQLRCELPADHVKWPGDPKHFVRVSGGDGGGWLKWDDADGAEREMQAVKRTPDEWCEQYGVIISDPDGWRHADALPWDEPITLADFHRRAIKSTGNIVSPGWRQLERDAKEAR